MMMKLATPLVAAMMLSGAAFAKECASEATPPMMPDPATATADDRSATIAEIKAYQAALTPYRDCLTAIADNKKLEKEERIAANAAFNASVDEEEKVVAAWQTFDAAWQAAHQ
ncbi:MAG: hypothetical protein AB7P23_11555 [Amphiplicatus sp.]